MPDCVLQSFLVRKSDVRTWNSTRSQPREVLRVCVASPRDRPDPVLPRCNGACGSPCLVQTTLGASTTTTTVCLLGRACHVHTPVSLEDYSTSSSSLSHTSIKAAGHGIAFAGRTFKEGGGPVDKGTGLAGLGLGPPTVPELGAHHQKALGWGLRRHQPTRE